MQRREISDEERAEYLADIASECDREIDLILNLLDLSRIKAGGVQINLKPVLVADVIVACEKIVRGEVEKYNHRIEIEIPKNLPPICADHSALRRALCAIFENATKFTPEDGRIRLCAETIDNEVLIEVEDNGRGIADEDLPHVFEKFYRGLNAGGAAQASVEEVPGIGLGLNLAQTLIRGMRGTIAVESRLGVGTKFTVRLPVWKEDYKKAEFELSEISADLPAHEISAHNIEKTSENGKNNFYDQTITSR
jgi:signal transduction histidine kinase